jgi:two-component system phosphate regulon sensor histidine kinase PhoR
LHSFQWRIAILFITLIVTSMLVLGVYVTNSVRNSQLDNLRFHLEQEAKIIAEGIVPFLQDQDYSPDDLVKKLASEIDSRVTIIAPDGTVLGDSIEDPLKMENHATRPEVKDALAHGIGKSTRYSTTLRQEMMYVAVPIYKQGELIGIARTALPLTTVESSVDRVTRIIILATIVIITLAAVAAWLIARTVTRPVRQLTKAAQKIAAGAVGQKIDVATKDEIGQLARAFNEMSSALKATIDNTLTEKNKLANVLGNMADGVIMTDVEGNVILTNTAAGKLFGFKEADSSKKQLIEVVHDHEVDEILKKCLETMKEQAVQFESSHAKRFLRAIAVPLYSQTRLNGVLILVQDLTELRNLQTMRRELIGNISHDLRTPLTSIKAMVETLQGSAIDDRMAAQDFLSRIVGELDHLTHMVAELTQLSRIEAGQAELKMERVDLNALVNDAITAVMPLAERQKIVISKDLSPDLPLVPADKDRIRQTIINLVNNAIKFNKPGGKVTISTFYDSNSVSVSVSDTGIGIAKEDLPHIFERFYKADKARSGGGSGLGLAIAKHTVQAHGGEIWAQSEEGKGSVFTFCLPRK